MTASPRLVHVVPRLGLSGPVRSLAAMARCWPETGPEVTHHVVALEPRAAPPAVLLLRREGVALTIGADDATRDEVLAAADLVIVHYWSCPSMVEFLQRPWPPGRVLLWVRTYGLHPPQVVPRAFVELADGVLVTSAGTLRSPALEPAGPLPTVVAPGIADMRRLDGWRPRAHGGFVVGYVGTVSYGKLHPRFVELCAAVRVPDARFIVCGGGGDEDRLRREADACGLGARFDVRGHVEDVGSVLAECDAFGYPLRADTYASSEKAVQEAMWVGIPPVVLPHGGVVDLMEHDRTGLVARSADEYVGHLEDLAADPGRRMRLGEAARAHARVAFDPHAATARLAAHVHGALGLDRCERAAPPWPPQPSRWFAHALGDHGGPFLRSAAAGPGGDPGAEEAIAASSDLVVAGEGGLFQWRNAFPEDAMLRRWTEVVLAARPHPAEAPS